MTDSHVGVCEGRLQWSSGGALDSRTPPHIPISSNPAKALCLSHSNLLPIPSPFAHSHLLRPLRQFDAFSFPSCRYHERKTFLLNCSNVLVTIGVTAAEYAQRRAALLSRLPPDAIALFPAAEHHKMTNDIPYASQRLSLSALLPSLVHITRSSSPVPCSATHSFSISYPLLY